MPLAALFIWPFISMYLISALGRVQGVIWAIMIGWLFLPEAYDFDLPGLPPLNKTTTIGIGILLGLMITQAEAAKMRIAEIGDTRTKRIMLLFATMFLLSPVITVFNNTAPLVIGPTQIKGLDLRDLIAMCSEAFFFLLIYHVAQKYLSDPKSHVMMLRAFMIAGMFYSGLVLFEVRMSPQLHTWIYGYFQHSWIQHIRGGQFRPIVFQPHGLWIGVLLMTCAMSAFVLFRNRKEQGDEKAGMKYVLAGMWLLGVLVLSRNFGATLLALMFVPIVWFLGRRLQIWITMGVLATFLVFPALRQSEIITFERTIEVFQGISPERAQSFAYRVRNEIQFLEKAAQKPVTGWGIWSRYRVHDPETGEDISTSDGRWIIVLGEQGWFGYIAYFGLLTAPMFLMLRTMKRRPLPHATAGLGLIMAAIMIYQVPNDTIGPLTLMIAGALAGYVIRAPEDVGAAVQANSGASHGGGARAGPGRGSGAAGRPAVAYSRFPPNDKRAARPLRR